MINIITGDLFSCDKTYSLAHCVSKDLKMSKGIALEFKNRFDNQDKLLEQNKNVGEVAYIKYNGRNIYYLITKNKFYQKPNYSNIRASLLYLKSAMINNGDRRLAMPRIGCGLDKLDWKKVYDILVDTFNSDEFEIRIYIK